MRIEVWHLGSFELGATTSRCGAHAGSAGDAGVLYCTVEDHLLELAASQQSGLGDHASIATGLQHLPAVSFFAENYAISDVFHIISPLFAKWSYIDI